MSLIKEYLEITKKYSEEYGDLTIVLMQNGAFFEVYALKNNNDLIYGCKLLDFSRICDLNIVDKKAAGDKNVTIDNDKVVNAGFKTHLLEKYIKKLQDAGYTIIVYEEDPEENQISKKKTRSLSGIYSPGTFFVDDIEQITNNSCCIWLEVKNGGLKNRNKKYIYIGISLIDIYTGHTIINEYKEEYIKNPTTFDELERFISINNPSETIIISNLIEQDINEIINFANIKSKSMHIVCLEDKNTNKNNKNVLRAKNCEKQTYQTELLSKFYKINDINSFMEIFYENVYATQSFCYLLDFIYQHNPNLVNKISEPILENANKKLILANHSLKQLNIIEDDNYKGKYSSVSKMLNECITSMGKRKFNYNFLNPVNDIEYLRKEYDIIETILNNMEDYNLIKMLLINVKDIEKLNRQIMLEKISPKEIYQLYNSIILGEKLYELINKKVYLKDYLNKKIKDFESLIEQINNIKNYLESVLFLDECREIDNIQKIEKSFIKEGVNSELDKQVITLMESEDQLECCRYYFSSVISNYEKGSSKQKKKQIKKIIDDDEEEEDDENEKSFVKLHETEKNNFSLIATDRRCKILDEAISSKKSTGVKLKYKSRYYNEERVFDLNLNLEYNKQSITNKIITTEQITKICKNVTSIKIGLIDTIAKVFKSIIIKLQNLKDNIDNISELITLVDIIFSKAFISEKYNYCKPEIVELNSDKEKSFVDIKELRHCLIEKIQQTELYVSNDIKLGNDELDGILLYGTNAVGKTSLIRALGISVIMAQSGLYVPASSYIYYPYKYIFTRILGNDNIFKGLSTFAVEMSELRTILRLANKNSLVLGDELCSGTESISAVSIFVSGVQALHKVKCSFIFATHLHEIINYDEIKLLNNVKMKHMSVFYDKELDCLVYDRKLKEGPGNNMYGLEVCKSLNLPQDFLDNAHNIRMKYHPESASILGQKGSHFNANKIKGLCENCGVEIGTEVHHLIHQKEANEKGVIKKSGLTLHKNNKANLMCLCEKCHNEIHDKGLQLKKIKTSKGIILGEV